MENKTRNLLPPTGTLSAFARIKKELRRWYGLISVKELTTNRELVFEIERLEQMLAHQGV